MRAAGLDPAEVTSPAIATALDAYAAVPSPSKATLATWKTIAPRRLFGAAKWPAERMRRVVMCAGRRSLKTSGLVSWACVYEALAGDHDRFAAPGSRIYYLIVAPLLAQAREAIRGVRSVLERLAPLDVSFVERDLAGSPELVLISPSRACEHVISVTTADSVAARGRAVAFVGFDEWGFAPSESWLSQSGADVVRAIEPSTAQFPGARVVFVSSPGPPQGIFFDLVSKRPLDVLLLRGPTWLWNPRVSRAMCERLAGGDAHALAQEYAASAFGYSGESFVDVSRVQVGSPHAGKGPRPGSFVFAVDLGGLGDDHAIVGVSAFEVEINPEHAPVRHVVCEVAETIAASKTNPVPIEQVAARVVELASAYGNAPIVFDPFSAPTLELHLRRLGYREYLGDGVPRKRHYARRSMAGKDQHPRWMLVKALCEGGRLHVASDHAVLVRQIARLHAVQQSSGAVKVDGRKDDLADCLALAAEIAMKLPTTGGPGGSVSFKYDGARWDDSGVSLVRPRWVRTVNGREIPCEMPEWAPGFEAHAREMIAQGTTTPAIERWRKRQEEQERARTSREGRATKINTNVRGD
jgi:hypothetical protein